jgi:sugar/nucleoside kinase (ribokinase family)
VVLGLKERPSTADALCGLALEIQARIAVETLVVHPVTYALAVTDGIVSVVEGPKVRKPLITTGAGDHFNSGFCVGKLLGLTDSESLLTGVTTSGFYVGNAKTPGIPDLSRMMQLWPV